MLKVEHVVTYGWEAAIRGMRNPMNSWEKSDTVFYDDENFWSIHTTEDYPCVDLGIGPNDDQLMKSLQKGGPVHAKFRRMINITMDITAPLYWWKEFDTYKVGTVANSCSTMHKIQAKEFTEDDFSCEHLIRGVSDESGHDDWYHDSLDQTYWTSYDILEQTILVLNFYRQKFLETNDKNYWWQMIQLLPSSYNQKRTVQLNYEVAAHIYPDRKDHKLDEWHVLCDEFDGLPYSWLITEKIPKEDPVIDFKLKEIKKQIVDLEQQIQSKKI